MKIVPMVLWLVGIAYISSELYYSKYFYSNTCISNTFMYLYSTQILCDQNVFVLYSNTFFSMYFEYFLSIFRVHRNVCELSGDRRGPTRFVSFLSFSRLFCWRKALCYSVGSTWIVTKILEPVRGGSRLIFRNFQVSTNTFWRGEVYCFSLLMHLVCLVHSLYLFSPFLHFPFSCVCLLFWSTELLEILKHS